MSRETAAGVVDRRGSTMMHGQGGDVRVVARQISPNAGRYIAILKPI